MSNQDDKKGSFATEEDLKNSDDFKEATERQRKKIEKLAESRANEAEAPIFKKLDTIIEVLKERNKLIKENTDAVNALTTTLITGPSVKPSTDEPEKELKKTITVIVDPETIPKVTSKQEKAEGTTLENIRMMFPEDLENMINFEEKEDHFKLSMRQFLGSDNFAKIAGIVRAMGGEYVRAGKRPYFKVPKGKIQTMLPESAPDDQQKNVPLPAPAKEESSMGNMEVLKNIFGDLAKLLNFEEKEDYVKVQPREFLGSDSFAKVARKVRELDGDYISAGKESHFRVPKQVG